MVDASAQQVVDDDPFEEGPGPGKARPAAPELVEEGLDEEGLKDGVPAWAKAWIPPELKIPPGKSVVFVRFPSAWTDAPDKGVPSDYEVTRADARGNPRTTAVERRSRILVCWPITVQEEYLALKRVRDPSGRGMNDELAKAMIRAVDGKIVDWTGANAAKEPDAFCSPKEVWAELGPKCRGPLRAQYLKLHQLAEEELLDFLENCVAVTTSVPA